MALETKAQMHPASARREALLAPVGRFRLGGRVDVVGDVRAGIGHGSGYARYRSEPRPGALGIDGDLQRRRLDRIYAPAVGEARLDLLALDAPRTPVTRLAVAEAQHEVMAAVRDRPA